MDENISRKAVLVLVLLSVIISAISTSLVLNSVYTINPAPLITEQKAEQPNMPGARATLTIPGLPAAPSQPAEAIATGKVVFEVKNP
jgi:hypothetical protein